MRRWAALAAITASFALLLLRCGSGGGGAGNDDVPLPDRGEPVDTGKADGPLDAGDASTRACDPAKPFATPVRLAEFDAVPHRSTPRLSADELTIYFTTIGDGSGANLSTASRLSKTAAFSGEKLLAQSTLLNDNDPSVGADHLTLWFHSNRNGTSDIFLATRSSTGVAFGTAAPIATVDRDASNENHAYFRQAASELWFISDRPAVNGGFDIYTSIRDGSAFSIPARVAEVSSLFADWEPQASEDGLTLLLASDRPGGKGKMDLWIARRPIATAKFSAPTPLVELNSVNDDQAGWLSADGCRIWFSSGRGTNDAHQQIFFAQRPK